MHLCFCAALTLHYMDFVARIICKHNLKKLNSISLENFAQVRERNN